MTVAEIPGLVQVRRRLANELLNAAAMHSAIVDEMHDLELLRDALQWSDKDVQRYEQLRSMRLDARRRHDRAVRDLRRLTAGARAAR